MDDEARARYDWRWQAYPFEHPRAYWIRSDANSMICTRCGGMLDALKDVALGDDPAKSAGEFVGKHLGCPLGHGFEQAKAQRGPDPLLVVG